MNYIARDRVITELSCTFVAILVSSVPFLPQLLELNSSQIAKVNCTVNRPGIAPAYRTEWLPQMSTTAGRFDLE